jgi:hypothetical protein
LLRLRRFWPFCHFLSSFSAKLFDEALRFDYLSRKTIFRQGSILQVHSMLADWAHSENSMQPVHRLLRICFSLLYALLTVLACSANASFAAAGDRDEIAPVCESEQQAPVEQAVVTPQAEGSDLHPPTSLRFDAIDSAFIFWQPPTLASSRIVPQGLVLSFLCDSARHQCSGVQLS